MRHYNYTKILGYMKANIKPTTELLLTPGIVLYTSHRLNKVKMFDLSLLRACTYLYLRNRMN